MLHRRTGTHARVSPDASGALDELEHAHRAVGGSRPGRRFLTQQLNYAYVTLLAARFQGFARALHTQTADVIAGGAHTFVYRALLLESLTHNRALERQNAQPTRSPRTLIASASMSGRRWT